MSIVEKKNSNVIPLSETVKTLLFEKPSSGHP